MVGLICKAQSRCKVVAIRRENTLSGGKGNQAGTRHKISDVSVLAVHWAKVLVAETKRQTQPLGRLPAILEVQAGGVDGHEPLGIADGNRRSGIVYVVRDIPS